MNSDGEVPELGSNQGSLRLRRLQQLVAALDVDGLLSVPGLDGRYNVGSAQVTGHLLLGASNREAADAVHLTPDLLDTVLLVTKQGLSAYVPNAKAAELVLDLFSDTITQLQIFCPTTEEIADPDSIEECKLGSFVQMLRGLTSLGIAWGTSTPTPDQPNPMDLEKWPLLQAYGLEGVGKAGFFTQNFKVVDVCKQLQEQVYGQLDGHSVEHLLAVAAPTLQQHWSEMIKAIGQKNAADLTERQVAEPLLSYFSYGMLRPAYGVSQAITMMPKVLVGARSNDDKASAEPLALKQAPGPAPGQPPVHLIAEAADARSPLRVARTYFLSQAALTPDHFADLEEEREEGYSFQGSTSAWAGDDALLLMRLYAAVVAAAHAAMQHFALEEAASAVSTRAIALDVLTQQCEALGVPQQRLAQQLRFALWECDHLNNVQAAAVRGSRRLKVLRLAVHDVQSRSSSHPGASLGAVVYADTFLEVPALGERPAQLLNLTQRLPALAAASVLGVEAAAAARALRSFMHTVSVSPELAAEWNEQEAGRAVGRRKLGEQRAERRRRAEKRRVTAVEGKLREVGLEEGEEEEEEEGAEEEEAEEEVEEVPRVLEGFGLLGRLLTVGGGEDAVLLTGAAACPSVRGLLWCFGAGLAFLAEGTHALWVLPFLGQLEAMTVQELRGKGAEGEGEGVGEAVVLRGRAPACGFAPACHVTTNRHLALALAGMTHSGRKHLLATVLPAWQRTCRESGAAAGPGDDCTISYLKDPTADSPFPGQQYAAMATAVHHAAGRRRWPAMALPDGDVEEALSRLDRAELATGRLGGLDAEVEQLLLRAPPAARGEWVGLTVVVGVPGSEQSSVAAALAGAPGETRVALVSGGLFVSQGQVDEALAALTGARHGVLVASCFDSTPALLGKVARSPGVVAGRLQLASVVVCVRSDLAVEAEARGGLTAWVPGVLQQVAAGYVDALVLAVGPGGGGEVQALLQKRLPPGVPLIVARGGSGRAALARARDELLGLPAAERRQRLADSCELRRWAAPVPGAPSTRPPQLLAGPLQSVLLSFTGELDQEQLRTCLQGAGLPAAAGAGAPPLPLLDPTAAPGSSPQQLLAAAGLLVLAAPGALPQELHASGQSALRARDSPLQGLTVVSGRPPALAGGGAGGELLLLGSALNAEALRGLLERCGSGAAAAAAAATAARRTAAALTTDELARIAKERMFDPLPDGCCFDGWRYRDEFGDVLPQHPHMAQFVEEFVAAENARLTADSAACDATASRAALHVTQVQQW